MSHLSPMVLAGQIHWPVLASQLFPTWVHWQGVHPPSWKLKCPGEQRSHLAPPTPGWQRHCPASSQSKDLEPNELQ